MSVSSTLTARPTSMQPQGLTLLASPPGSLPTRPVIMQLRACLLVATLLPVLRLALCRAVAHGHAAPAGFNLAPADGAPPQSAHTCTEPALPLLPPPPSGRELGLPSMEHALPSWLPVCHWLPASLSWLCPCAGSATAAVPGSIAACAGSAAAAPGPIMLDTPPLPGMRARARSSLTRSTSGRRA